MTQVSRTILDRIMSETGIPEAQLVPKLQARGHQVEGYRTESGFEKYTDFVYNDVMGIGNPFDAAAGRQTGGVLGAVQGAVNVLQGGKRADAIRDTSQRSQRILEEAKKFPQGDPRRKTLLGQSRYTAEMASEEAGTELTRLDESPTAIQAAGSSLKVASLALMASGIATKAVPFSKLTALGRVGNAGVVGAEFGALGGLSGGAVAGETDPGKLAKSTLMGTLIGAGTGIITQGTVEAVRAALKYFPERFMTSKLKEPLQAEKAAKRSQLEGWGKSPVGKEAVERGVSGTPEQMYHQSTAKLNAADDKLQEALNNPKFKDVTITKLDLKPYIDDYIDDMVRTPGERATVDIYREVFNDTPSKMTLAEANAIKRGLYKVTGQQGYVIDAKLSATRDAQKLLAHAIKDLIDERAPMSVIPLNAEVGAYKRIQDAVLDLAARQGRFSLGGLSFWHQLTKMLNTTWGVTKSAVFMQKLADGLNTRMSDLGPVRSVGIFLVSSLIGSEVAKTDARAEVELERSMNMMLKDAVLELNELGYTPEQMVQTLNYVEGQQIADVSTEDIMQILSQQQ